MAPPVPAKPPIDGQDPHRAWEEYMLYDLAERVNKLTDGFDDLAVKFNDHIRDEGNQYASVSRKLDRLFTQAENFHAVAIEFKQCRDDFKSHVDGTKKDHEDARFFFRLAAWGGGAVLFIATNAQVVIPVFERLLGAHL